MDSACCVQSKSSLGFAHFAVAGIRDRLAGFKFSLTDRTPSPENTRNLLYIESERIAGVTGLTNGLVSEIRKYIFDFFGENAASPVLEQIMRKFNLDRAAAYDALAKLQDAHHIALVKGTQRILMAFPFSSVVTPFRVSAGGKTYYANCAWDAIAIHVTLGIEEVIYSYCHHCAEEIRIHTKDQHVVSSAPGGALVYLALPASKWWEDIVNTCSNNMVFFSSSAHLDEWKSRGGISGGAALSPEQIIKLSLPIYSTKMNLDYARPPKDQLIAHFESMGLTGNFWKL